MIQENYLSPERKRATRLFMEQLRYYVNKFKGTLSSRTIEGAIDSTVEKYGHTLKDVIREMIDEL